MQGARGPPKHTCCVTAEQWMCWYMGLLWRGCVMRVCMHWCRRLLWHHVRGVKARGGDLVVGYVVTAFEVYRDIKNVNEGKCWRE